MKTQYIVALAVASGFALGAVAVQGLHAQAKPPAYTVSEIDVTNVEAFNKEFAPLAQKALAESGAKAPLARGGKVAAIDGAPPKSRVVINAFENIDKAVAAFNSPAYREARKIGDKYATFRIYAVEGIAQ